MIMCSALEDDLSSKQVGTKCSVASKPPGQWNWIVDFFLFWKSWKVNKCLALCLLFNHNTGFNTCRCFQDSLSSACGSLAMRSITCSTSQGLETHITKMKWNLSPSTWKQHFLNKIISYKEITKDFLNQQQSGQQYFM